MKRVKILGTAITQTHGTLTTGDIVNVADEFADHLVNDCKIAEYLQAPADEERKASTVEAAVEKTKKTAKETKAVAADVEQAPDAAADEGQQ